MRVQSAPEHAPPSFEDGKYPPTRRALIRSVFYPGQKGTDLNPTENAFGGDPEKMSNEGQHASLIGHLRTQPPSKMGTPALPRPLLSQRVPVSV